ncbi:MAG: hypothetical protein AAGA77_12450 [Bacteroidota bacterium]
MFKAKLIENKKYYQLRAKQAWLMLIPTILLGLIINFYQFPTWIIISAVLALVCSYLIMLRNQNALKKLSNQNAVELDEKEIRIRSLRSGTDECFSLDEVDKIIVQEEYGIPQESYTDLTEEMMGLPKENFMIILNKKEKRKIDFEIESHYMLTQLNKVIKNWIQNGVKIETVL